MKKWSKEDISSIVESLLLASDKPLKMSDFLSCMGEEVKPSEIKNGLFELGKIYQNKARGISLREAAGGWQLITKDENKDYVRYLKKSRPFRLSKPALEVLSIIAYQQPCTRGEINQIRRTDSGHILRSLMDRDLAAFAGQSEQPGKPMMYKTTKKFLEVYGLKNLKNLPSLDNIKDEFLPEDAQPLKFKFDSACESIKS